MLVVAEHIEVNTESVSCPLGFKAGGIACGIKASGGPDLALIVADRLVSAAGMFTRNLLRAAPVQISARHLQHTRGKARALLINSGCANAATGAEGFTRAERTIAAAARLLGCDPAEVLENSTGVIGKQLPDEKIIQALPALVREAASDGFGRAMDAIMTTDTRRKMAEARVEHDGRRLHVAGIAKGAGMIHPNMATMIGVLLTDAQIESNDLDATLRVAVDGSFHRISVDGDTSTNDSVFALASGAAGEFPREVVQSALNAVARELALMVVRDGEGATKLIHVRVREAASGAEALKIAQTVAGSMLVRTAVYGGDPNWGRIVAAIGRSRARVDLDRLRVDVNGVALFENGAPAASALKERERAFQAETVRIDVALGLGAGSDEFFTCDLTEGYVKVNAHYMT